MAYVSSQPNAEFGAGLNHVTNPGRANAGSITLGPDPGLSADSARWDSMTPHGVLRTASGTSQGDGAFEQLERQQGGYRAGSMPRLQDELSNG